MVISYQTHQRRRFHFGQRLSFALFIFYIILSQRLVTAVPGRRIWKASSNRLIEKSAFTVIVPGIMTVSLYVFASKSKVKDMQKDCQSNLQFSTYSFDEKFLEIMMKLAWIQRTFLKIPDDDNEILQLLKQLEDLAGPDKGVKPSQAGEGDTFDRTFLQGVVAVKDERALDKVGVDRAHSRHVMKWLCPEDGHVFDTHQRKNLGRTTVGLSLAAGIATGAGVVSCGGSLGCVIANLTTGKGWCTLVMGAGAGAASLLHSKVNGAYMSMLLDLHSWVGSNFPASSESEFELEQSLIQAVEQCQARWESLVDESKQRMENLYKGIKLIHLLKKHDAPSLISIVGPQKSGKSLLTSLLMMKPQIAKKESHGTKHTEDSPLHVLTKKAVVVDTPGLTSVKMDIKEKYFKGAHYLSFCHIYIRPFGTGTLEDYDVEAIFKILFDSHLPSPPLLICLNKMSQLSRDGASDLYPSVEDLKESKENFRKELIELIRAKGKDKGFLNLINILCHF